MDKRDILRRVKSGDLPLEVAAEILDSYSVKFAPKRKKGRPDKSLSDIAVHLACWYLECETQHTLPYQEIKGQVAERFGIAPDQPGGDDRIDTRIRETNRRIDRGFRKIETTLKDPKILQFAWGDDRPDWVIVFDAKSAIFREDGAVWCKAYRWIPWQAEAESSHIAIMPK